MEQSFRKARSVVGDSVMRASHFGQLRRIRSRPAFRFLRSLIVQPADFAQPACMLFFECGSSFQEGREVLLQTSDGDSLYELRRRHRILARMLYSA